MKRFIKSKLNKNIASFFNTSENRQKIKNALKRRGISSLKTHNDQSGIKFRIVEDNGKIKIIFSDRSYKYDDTLAEFLSDELGVTVKESPEEDSFSTIYEIVEKNI